MIRVDPSQINALIAAFKEEYTAGEVNKWIRSAFAKKSGTPKPLVKALKQVTPKRRKRGGLRTTVDSEVHKFYDGEGGNEPVLVVGGRKSRGGFIYHFLRGTVKRKTKKGRNRGRIPDLGLGDKAFRLGANRAHRLFTRSMATFVRGKARAMQRRVNAAGSPSQQ